MGKFYLMTLGFEVAEGNHEQGNVYLQKLEEQGNKSSSRTSRRQFSHVDPFDFSLEICQIPYIQSCKIIHLYYFKPLNCSKLLWQSQKINIPVLSHCANKSLLFSLYTLQFITCIYWVCNQGYNINNISTWVTYTKQKNFKRTYQEPYDRNTFMLLHYL